MPMLFYILRRHVAATFEEGVGFGGEGKRNGRARGSAELNEIFDRDFIMVRIARGAHEVHDVILHFVIYVNIIDDQAGIEDLPRVHHGFSNGRARGFGHGCPESAPFLGARRDNRFLIST